MQHLYPNSLLQGGRYKILSTLGQGGFGITYLAVQSGLERKVAIKEFFMKELCERDESTSHVTLGTEGSRETVSRFREKFLKEARNIAKLDHPNIVSVIDVFEENGTAYYVMKYAENGSLSDKVKREGYFTEPVATRYILQVASALDYIHQQKMNHLDVKPANIMLNEKDEAVLIDFGLSKQYDAVTGSQTSTTPVGISHGYAPMEQYREGGVGEFSPETDIYALGATYFKLLTGVTPPSASDVNEDGVPVDELKAKGVSTNAISIICKAMEGRKKDRMKNIRTFIDGLKGNASTSYQSAISDDDEATILTPDLQKAEKERLRKEVEAKAAKERAEAEARAKAEAERKAREDAERKKQEKAEHKAREDEEAKRKASQKSSSKMWIGIVTGIVIIVFASIGLNNLSNNSNDITIQEEDTITQVENYVSNDTIMLKTLPIGKEQVLDSKYDKYVKVEKDNVDENAYMIYTGYVKEGIPDGQGEAIFSDGRKYIGTFHNGQFHDENGILTDKEGFKYEASFVNGYLAKGKYTLWEKGKVQEVFEGIFVHNGPCTGTFYDGKGDKTIILEHGQVVWWREDNIQSREKEDKYMNNNKVEDSHSNSQTVVKEDANVVEQTDNTIYQNSEQMPSYPGGLTAYYSFVNSRLKYPTAAQENGVQGRVVIGFVVEKDGSLSNVKVTKSVTPELDNEALRIVRQLPTFIPGKNGGKNVRVYMSLPITFHLQ